MNMNAHCASHRSRHFSSMPSTAQPYRHMTLRNLFAVRRMAKEQEDYVRKQEARRARAHQPTTDHGHFTDFAFGSHESLFSDFFAVSKLLLSPLPHYFKCLCYISGPGGMAPFGARSICTWTWFWQHDWHGQFDEICISDDKRLSQR